MKILITTILAQVIILYSVAQNSLINTKWKAHIEIPRSADIAIEFKKDTFLMYRPNGAVGEWTYFLQQNDSLFVRKISGFFPCPNEAQGWYKIEWLENGENFLLHNLSDSCKPRSNSWTGMRVIGRITPANNDPIPPDSSSRVIEKKLKIPMRDGTKLNAFVYADSFSTEKLPVIVSLSPYLRGNESNRGNVFAANGYIYVYVNNRGIRESEGVFEPFENDAQDYYDIIDWISKQSWCNGQVAATGGSYVGFTQWQAIRKQFKHPALKAINPMVSIAPGIEAVRKNDQFEPYNLFWISFVTGKRSNQTSARGSTFWNNRYYELYKNRIPFSKLDSVAGMPDSIFQKWISHPKFDSYWQNILPNEEDYGSIDIPILSITGYYDDDQNGAMYYFNNHQSYGNAKAKSNHYLLIGPYDHFGSQWNPGTTQGGSDTIEKEALVPIYKYVISWFDWVLKGKKKPDFIKDRITYFETGNNVWKGTGSFKEITTDSLELFLSPSILKNERRNDLLTLDGKKPSGNTTLKYKHDIAMALDSAYLFATPKPYDDSLYMTSPYNFVFESKPLQKDVIITNRILVRLYMSLNVPDADFEISIQEISPDGKNRNLAWTTKRVRYRNSGEKPQLVKPGEVFLLNFDKVFIYVKKLSKGTRLRLIFQSQNDHRSEKNFAFGGEVSKESTLEPRIIEATIMMSNKYPSKVVVPYKAVR
jgi:putative CocE/NonD family hydrolase